MQESLASRKQQLIDFLASYPHVTAAYLFGSQATGESRSGSDVDIAILMERGLGAEFYIDQQLYLGGKLCEVLGRDDIDLVLLNRTSSSELKFSIVQDGELLVNRSTDLAEYELRVKHEYYDHLAALRRAGYDQ